MVCGERIQENFIVEEDQDTLREVIMRTCLLCSFDLHHLIPLASPFASFDGVVIVARDIWFFNSVSVSSGRGKIPHVRRLSQSLHSTTNEDLAASQFKESNVYIPGQQSEGSAVWIAAPGRDISSLPASSFYNLPPQGQHVTFAPSQAGHGTFAGIYYPRQAVTATTVHPLVQQSQTMAGSVDMVGPAANVYQQPQHAQINWPSY